MDSNIFNNGFDDEYLIEEFEQEEKPSRSLAKELFEWCEAVVFSLVFVVLIFTFVFRIVGVEGDSMKPTLHSDDRVIITHLFYKPKAGDIVVVTKPTSIKKPIIKRIIATENQEVYIDFEACEVYVDGELLDEPYIMEPTRKQADVEFPVTVPPGHVFVMGDNRNNSRDSRESQIGMIDERYILGKAIFRIYPFNRIGNLK